MKNKFIFFISLLLMGTLVGGLISINANIDPLKSIGATMLVMAAFSRLVQVPFSSLATVMNPATFHWTGTDVEEIFFRPRYKDMKPEDLGFRIVFTESKVKRLHFMGKLGKILMAYASGFQGGASGNKYVREFTVKEFKAEIAYDRHDYDDTMFEIFFRDGIQQNDIDGTKVMEAEQKVFSEALDSDTVRYFWLGKTSKVHIAAGTYPDGTAYAIGDPDKYYNQVNGVLEEIYAVASATPTADQVKKITMPVLGTDDAMDTMKAMLLGSTPVLKSLKDSGQLRFYATDDFIQNYEDTLTADGTEAAHAAVINGVSTYKWNGIPIQRLGVDQYLADDFSGVPTTICILSTPENLGLVLNARDSKASVRMWFNEDENERRQRAQFKMKPDFILPELVTIAY